jgi:hypothetical protein
MKVYQKAGYPKNHYFVKDFRQFREIVSWMKQNDVEYLHESSSRVHGVGFSVRKNFEWFSLRWS